MGGEEGRSVRKRCVCGTRKAVSGSETEFRACWVARVGVSQCVRRSRYSRRIALGYTQHTGGRVPAARPQCLHLRVHVQSLARAVRPAGSVWSGRKVNARDNDARSDGI